MEGITFWGGSYQYGSVQDSYLAYKRVIIRALSQENTYISVALSPGVTMYVYAIDKKIKLIFNGFQDCNAELLTQYKKIKL